MSDGPETSNPASAAARTGSGASNCSDAFDGPINTEIRPANQAPRATVFDARLLLIREELYGELEEIAIFAERGMRALEVENDLDLGRAFDQAVKHFRAVAANLEALILVKTGTPS